MVIKPRMSFCAALFVLAVACGSSVVAGTMLGDDQMQVIRGGCDLKFCGNDNPCDAPYGCDPLSLGECTQCTSSNKAQSCVSSWLGVTSCSSQMEDGYCGNGRRLTECHIVQAFPVMITQCSGGFPDTRSCAGEHCTVF